MTTVYLGIDVSKGYADFVALNEAGSELGGWGRFDDTRAGHDQVQARVAAVLARAPETQVVVGVESTGGYERNWLGLCHRLSRAGWALTAYRLNPLVVKRYHERQLHRTVTDRISAAGIAAYLRAGRRRQDQLWVAGELEGALTLYRTVRRLVRLQADLQNQLQALLSRCHPELVACLRGGLRQWVLTLLQQYPTAAVLAQADPAAVARIPYVTPAAAARLVAAAAASVADQTDPATGRAVRVLVDEIAHLRLQVRRLQTELAEQLRTDPGVQIIDSIPGFGIWSAICLRLELGISTAFPARLSWWRLPDWTPSTTRVAIRPSIGGSVTAAGRASAPSSIRWCGPPSGPIPPSAPCTPACAPAARPMRKRSWLACASCCTWSLPAGCKASPLIHRGGSRSPVKRRKWPSAPQWPRRPRWRFP